MGQLKGEVTCYQLPIAWAKCQYISFCSAYVQGEAETHRVSVTVQAKLKLILEDGWQIDDAVIGTDYDISRTYSAFPSRDLNFVGQ